MPCATELEDDLLEYSDFEETGDVARARRFITSANRWLIATPVHSRDQFSEMRFQHSHILELLRRAQEYVAVNDDTNSTVNGSVRFLGFSSDFRG